MKIEYVTGNLFDTPHTYIMHGCNAQGVMGSGVAKQIKTLYPGAFRAYREKYLAYGTLELGDIIPYLAPDNKIIVNAITQKFYGRDGKRYVDYDAIANCILALESLHKISKSTASPTLALPKIGATLGGGDWAVIEKVIESSTKILRPTVYLYQNA